MDHDDMPQSHLLALPVFDEAQYIKRVIDGARRFPCDILVIDDGSTDRTPQLLREYDSINVVTHAENRGYGKSVADAFAFAQRHGCKWLITMDCDGQHEPSHIPLFMAATVADDADVISGTRYPNGYGVDAAVPADRREINRQITALLNRRLGLGITDAFCGFKAYRVAALRHIHITVPGYAMPMQWWVQVARANLRVREIPVRLIYHDGARYFGGLLDNPKVRLQHYLDVFEAELASGRKPLNQPDADCLRCR